MNFTFRSIHATKQDFLDRSDQIERRLKDNQRQHENRFAEIEKADSLQHQHWKQKLIENINSFAHETCFCLQIRLLFHILSTFLKRKIIVKFECYLTFCQRF